MMMSPLRRKQIADTLTACVAHLVDAKHAFTTAQREGIETAF